MKTLCLALIASLTLATSAQSLTDTERADALRDTQNLLRDKTARQKAIDADSHAKDTDNKVTALVGGGQNKEDMYELSAQLMEKISSETKGDPAKMQELLLQAQKDPEGFYNKYMNAAQKSKVNSIAGKIDKSAGSVSPNR